MKSIKIVTIAMALSFGLRAGERVAVLDVEVRNAVIYRYDVADPSQVASTAAPTPTTLNNAFTDFCQLGDIVSVNGKPARGLHMTCATRMGFSPTAAPGFAIADVTQGGGRQECNWQLHTADGRFVGRLVDGGFAPHAVQGGAGAYLGATGEHVSAGISPVRVASVVEDPSRRRANGGGSYRVTFYLIPKFWPEVVLLPEGGPAIFHGDDFSKPVNAANPARPGELLVMVAKGLGPTLPGPTPPGTRLFSGAPPYNEVSSALEITVNGVEADVIGKIGWPGTRDMYRVDFRLPSGTAAGEASLQLTSAWIPAEEVRISVQ